jgi:cathepsin B
MFKLVIVGTIATFALAQEAHPINSAIVSEIRNKATTWAAHDVEENPLKDLSIEEIKARLGTIVQPPIGLPGPLPYNGVLPAHFDSREQWAGCVHEIRDQAQCGSCWAFAASETLSDRFCIASNKATDVVLSPEDLVACDNWNMGCNGGILPWAWSYLTTSGAVSDSCFPYSSNTGVVPKCASSCADGSTYRKYKCTAGSVVEASGVDQIKNEIFNNGPLETGFTVYEDFMSYKGGVYKHTTGSQLGGHAVKIIGWGDGYWIAANSWGPKWGEKGFFNIAFGECGFDSAAYGCKPKL